MKNERIISCIGIIFGGMILDIICFAVSVLAYINFSDTLFSFSLLGLIFTGCIISITIIIHNRPSVGLMFKRCLILFFSFFFFFVTNGYLGIIRCLYDILNVNVNSSSDNASGMLIATYILILIFVCMSTIICKAVHNKCRRRTGKTGDKTGDGSLS